MLCRAHCVYPFQRPHFGIMKLLQNWPDRHLFFIFIDIFILYPNLFFLCKIYLHPANPSHLDTLFYFFVAVIAPVLPENNARYGLNQGGSKAILPQMISASRTDGRFVRSGADTIQCNRIARSLPFYCLKTCWSASTMTHLNKYL